MPVLRTPTTSVRESFLEAMAELRTEASARAEDSTINLHLREHGADWSTPEGFARYVRWVRGLADEESAPRPEGHVPETVLWWIDGTTYLGRISVRHWLTPHLRRTGGAIGYDVRPSARRRGHATAMLRAALPVARSMRMDPVLVTCAAGNLASRLTIERNGGVLFGRAGDTLRYWVPAV